MQLFLAVRRQTMLLLWDLISHSYNFALPLETQFKVVLLLLLPLLLLLFVVLLEAGGALWP